MSAFVKCCALSGETEQADTGSTLQENQASIGENAAADESTENESFLDGPIGQASTGVGGLVVMSVLGAIGKKLCKAARNSKPKKDLKDDDKDKGGDGDKDEGGGDEENGSDNDD